MSNVCVHCKEETFEGVCENTKCISNTTNECIECGDSFDNKETRCTREACADNLEDDEEPFSKRDMYRLNEAMNDQISDQELDNEEDDDKDINDNSRDRDD